MVLHVGQLLLDITIFLGMLIAETQVLKLFLYFVQPKSVGQRCIDVQSLSCYLVLLVGQLTAQRAHVVQAVGYLDKYHADVVTHGEEQFLEALCLCRRLVSEDSTRYLGESVGNLCYLGTEYILDILHRVVGILYHIMKQCSTYAGTAQPYLLAGNLRHGDGVHDVRFA